MAAIASATRASVRPLTIDPGALGGQRLGDGEADAGGGAGDERQLAGELQIHGVLPSGYLGRDVDHDFPHRRPALEMAMRVRHLF